MLEGSGSTVLPVVSSRKAFIRRGAEGAGGGGGRGRREAQGAGGYFNAVTIKLANAPSTSRRTVGSFNAE